MAPRTVQAKGDLTLGIQPGVVVVGQDAEVEAGLFGPHCVPHEGLRRVLLGAQMIPKRDCHYMTV